MSVLSSKSGNVLIVTPQERLDTNTAPNAEKMISENIKCGETKIVIDLSKTDYLSSSGLRVIMKTSNMLLHQKDGAVVLCGLNDQIQDVLKISGFSNMIRSFSTLDEAIKQVQSLT
jgi:anti-sigma B factor antagonist